MTDFGYSIIDVGGPDALMFLQGQLTQDLRHLRADEVSIAAWVNPAGRVIVLMDVLKTSEGFRLFLPDALAGTIQTRLLQFRFRSRIDITTPEGLYFRVVEGHGDTSQALDGGSILRRLDSEPRITECFCIAAPYDVTARQADGRSITRSRWLLARLQAGIPFIETETSERYTAHQLNLDLIGAISLNKGCYSGQEIIARTHNLGRVKRRIRRLTAGSAGGKVGPGDAILAAEKKIGTVVTAARSPGRLELLALLPVGVLPDALCLADGTALRPASMPYTIPPA